MVISKATAEKYKWGDQCEAWVLLDKPELSIKQERMPGETSEILHEHCKAQQFFYILHGQAKMKINNESYQLKAGEGIHIASGCKHKIINESKEELEFLVISEPTTKGDRNELKEKPNLLEIN